MIVCAYYTDDSQEKYAQRLRVSAKEVGLDVDIRRMAEQGSWERNASLRPLFGRQMLEEHKGRNVLLVDVSAVIRSRPTDLLVPSFLEDVALYSDEKQGPVQGTMWFRGTYRARMLCTQWHRLNEFRNLEASQDTLRAAITKPRLVPVHFLGPEYFWVERLMRRKHPRLQPVVEHFSREESL